MGKFTNKNTSCCMVQHGDIFMRIRRESGLSLAHEDEQGGFVVEELKERNLRWVAGAAKRYARIRIPVDRSAY